MPFLTLEFETEAEMAACKACLSGVLKAFQQAHPHKNARIGKTKKKTKDPNAPKRNLNSYMLYTGEVRKQVAAVNPSLKVTEVVKIIGKQWRELSDEAKKKYVDLAAEDKVRYKKEFEAYQNPSTDEPASSSTDEPTSSSDEEE
jgi:hypothetical protein